MVHFSEQYFAKSESGSSMDDSAYVSHADTGRGNGHDNTLINFDSFLCSPTMSSVSQGYQVPQFTLPDPATDSTGFASFPTSDSGIYGNTNTFSSPSSHDMTGWSSQTFNGHYASPIGQGSLFHQPTINPQFAINPFYNGSEKPVMKRAQMARPQLDTNPSVLHPGCLTSPSPVSSVRHRPASVRSTSGADLSLADLNAADAKSVSDYKDDDLDDDSLSVPLSASGRMIEDAESKMARTHPLYQATPGKDDLYHCPQEGKPGCNHKPTKLKCNYDKYVDSHLRPYKCKITSCEGIQFSSTACLLRHEREAHGMHGHGSKPNLCSFHDCERSLPGNGFPRRYNLYDHMKRVHEYTPTDNSPEELSPVIPPGVPAKRSNNRKRKATMTEEPSEKRQKSIAIKTQPVMEPVIPQKDLRAEQVNKLRGEWTQRHNMAYQCLQNFQDPLAMQFYGQLNDDLAVMHKIAQKINELSG